MRKLMITLVMTVIFILGCGDNTNASRNGEIAEVALDIADFVIKHPALRLLALLKIVRDTSNIAFSDSKVDNRSAKVISVNAPLSNGKTVKIDAYQGKDELTFHLPDQEMVFSPNALVKKYNLQNASDVELLDMKIKRDYRECTSQVLNNTNIDHANHLEMLATRVMCLNNRGYGNNETAYMQIKSRFNLQSI